MATKETDLERQKREAAENDDFQRWASAYRTEQGIADQWGGGLINGRPAATVVDPTQVASLSAGPQGQLNNPDATYLAAERIASQTDSNRRSQGAPVVNDAYNSFLLERGINPDSMGGAQMVTGKDGRRGMLIPSIKEQDEARQLSDQLTRMSGRDRIAARQLERRGQPGAAAAIRNDLDLASAVRGGRSSEGRFSYAQNLLQSLRPVIQRQQQIDSSNGFAPSYNAPFINSQIPDAPLNTPRRYDWDRYRNYA